MIVKFQLFTLVIEVFTAIIATIYFYKYRNSFIKYYLLLLWYIAINESLGYFIGNHIDKVYNAIIYNIYNVINFCFLLVMYKHFIKNKTQKKYINIFITIYLISFVVNGFYEDYFTYSQTIPYIIGSCFLIISILMYFIQILKSEDILKISRNLLIWISIGLLLFHIGYIPFKLIRKYYDLLYANSLQTLRILFFSLILILNICYIIGFTYSNKIMKKSQQ